MSVFHNFFLTLTLPLSFSLADAETTIPIYEDPYQDPIDAVVPQREGSQFLARSNTTSTDEAYATVEECGFRPKRKVRVPGNDHC